MSLVTGTPLGNIIAQEDLYVEGAPYIYFQNYAATPLNHPDGDGFFWGLSGTTPNPVYNIGCVMDVTLTENLTVNAIRCDTVGDKDVIQKRNHLELNLTISTLFPLSELSQLLNISASVTSGHLEKAGIGDVPNTRKFHLYMPKVYDPDTGDWIMFHLHKCKFVDAWTIGFKHGEPWQITGLKVWAFADDTYPDAQMFGTILRADPSAIP